MTTREGAVHVGEWVEAQNLAADATGSIHDDAEARRLGLPGGLVPGNVQLILAQRILVELLGPAWYERGVLSFRWSRPVYHGEELRAVLAPASGIPEDERAFELRIEKRDESRVADGHAGVARSPEQVVPPWERRPAETGAGGGPDPLPEEPIGMEFPVRAMQIDADEVEGMLAGLDPCAWYRDASPWGGPILPTVSFLSFTGQGRPRRAPSESSTSRPLSRIRAGMNGALELVHRGPMFRDAAYQRRVVVIDKGYAKRTAFRTLDVSLADGDGRGVLRAHWRANWFPGEGEGS